MLVNLITDAVENSQIRIDLIETEMGIIYNFSNTGFGMPNSVFRQYLSEDADAASPEFKKLRAVISQVQEWGGKLRASSEVGVGIRFTMQLKSGPCH